MAKTTKTTAKQPTKKSPKKATSAKSTSAAKKEVVDFYPNKMGFAVASLAAVTLVLLGLIAVTN